MPYPNDAPPLCIFPCIIVVYPRSHPTIRRKWRKGRTEALQLPFPGRQNDDYQTFEGLSRRRRAAGTLRRPGQRQDGTGPPRRRSRSVTKHGTDSLGAGWSGHVVTLCIDVVRTSWHSAVVVGTVAMTVNQRQQRHRERKRAIAAGASELELRLRDLAVTDPAGAVAEWSAAVLVVPPGHPRAGEPMTLPPYAVSWLREALAPTTRESLLCMARKNAKSAVCAVLALACVCGPLWRQGFRGAVVSINVAKAGELVRQAHEIATSQRADDSAASA